MKRVALWLLLFGVALGVRAQSPDAEFLKIYTLIQEGESLERTGQRSDAADRFQTAQRELQAFAKAYPSWNEKIVRFRLNYLSGKVGLLTVDKPAPAPVPSRPADNNAVAPVDRGSPQDLTPALAAERDRAERAIRSADQAMVRANRADERNAQLALDLRVALDRVEVLQSTQSNLEAARNRLERESVTLEARLKEALAPKPAARDPGELSRAQERNLLLMKENEILKASLEHQMAENKRIVETAGKALELEKQLGLARTELATLRRENNDLQSERRKLAARVESLGRKADPSAALRSEIETLKHELTEARAGSSPADPGTELARLRSDLADQRTVVAELRTDNATLVRELEKLTAIKVTPASLKSAEVVPMDLAAVESSARVRSLERERDDLRRALEETRAELRRRERSGEARGGELNRKVQGLEARIATLEAKPEPYSKEELALFQPPSRPVDLARGGATASGTAGAASGTGVPKPVQVAQANLPPATGATSDATPTNAPGTSAASSGSGAGSPPNAAANPSIGTNSAPAAGTARRRTLRDLPPGSSILAAQAQRAFSQRRFEDAEKSYREILTLDENNVFTLGNLAAILVERGRLEEGEAMLKRALEADPQDPFSLSLQGIIRFRQQRYDEAFDSLSRSAVLDSENADTQNYLGITLSQRGQRKAAEAALRKALKLSPASPAAHYNLAVVYATQKPPFLALAKYHYEKARRSGQPPNPAFEGVLRGETPVAEPQ